VSLYKYKITHPNAAAHVSADLHCWYTVKGVSLQYLLYYKSVNAVKRQVNGQGSFKAKDDGQKFLVDGQNYVNKVVQEKIAKINGVRSKVKKKF